MSIKSFIQEIDEFLSAFFPRVILPGKFPDMVPVEHIFIIRLVKIILQLLFQIGGIVASENDPGFTVPYIVRKSSDPRYDNRYPVGIRHKKHTTLAGLPVWQGCYVCGMEYSIQVFKAKPLQMNYSPPGLFYKKANEMGVIV